VFLELDLRTGEYVACRELHPGALLIRREDLLHRRAVDVLPGAVWRPFDEAIFYAHRRSQMEAFECEIRGVPVRCKVQIVNGRIHVAARRFA
jgi:hypothetical protein